MSPDETTQLGDCGRLGCPQEDARRFEFQLRLVRAIATLVIVISSVVLTAWLFGIDLLSGVVPASDRLKANAAVAFLLLGILLQRSTRHAQSTSDVRLESRNERMVSYVLAGGVTLIGTCTLLEYAFGAFGIDELLASDASDASSGAPGRMSVIGALTLIALGVAFVLRTARPDSRAAALLCLAAFLSGYVALLGYVYDVEALYRVGATAMLLQAAICVLLVAFACLITPPYVHFMRPVTSASGGGVLLRRLLPVALIVAPAVDWVQTQADPTMHGLSMALLGLANVLLLVVLVWATGKAVYLAQHERTVAQENVKATEERLQLALQAAAGGAWDLDLRREEAWWSTEMFRLWEVEPVPTMSFAQSYEIIDPRDRERVQSAVEAAISRRGIYECEFRIRSSGPHERWMASRGQVHYDEAGIATRLIGITLDITAKRAAEQSLQRTNEALIRSNIELQRFANVAAHDLQTPLRGIASFAELLKMRCADKLDEKGQEWLERILGSAVHLQALVRDLLLYAGIETQRSAMLNVAMEEVFDEVLVRLKADIHTSECRVTRTNLPVVIGDAAQLAQLLLNLLSNAIKYRAADAPRIHVAAVQSGDEWIFSVADNGIGIEQRHAERIFEMFERLHNAQDYPGTGIGLAICRRVVQRHGGRIWVESHSGRGSTFFFTIPAALAAQ